VNLSLLDKLKLNEYLIWRQALAGPHPYYENHLRLYEQTICMRLF
jgi:hypothetical protein